MKNIKIVSLVLSMLLLIGAAVGIASFANDAPSVEIAQKNISYDGAVKTLYAVKTENAGDATVSVRFYDADPSTAGANLLYTKEAYGTITIGEEELQVVFSKGFSPSELRKSVWAVPVLTAADGNVVCEGEAVEYSPYIYAMNRFDGSATKDQLTLYTALLDYGAAVQRVLSTPDEVAANGGYADEYYELTVNNAFATDVAEKYYVLADTFSKAEIEAGAIKADDILEGVEFVAWADENGNPLNRFTTTLSTVMVKPGRTSLTALYGHSGAVRVESSDFTKGNPSGFIETVYNIKSFTGNTNGQFAFESIESLHGTSSVTDSNGVYVHTKVLIPTENFDETTINSYSEANYQWWRVWLTGSGTQEDIYVAEFDAKFTNFSGEGNLYANISGFNKVTISPSLEKDENGYSKYFTLGTATLENDVSYKLRFEWFTDTDTICAYVDGVLAYSHTASAPVSGDSNYTWFRFETGALLEGVSTFDNMYYATECVHNGYEVDYTNVTAIAGPGEFYNTCTECKCGDTLGETHKYTGNRGEGVYYNNAIEGTRYDMSTIPAKNYQTTPAQTWTITEDGALEIYSTAWAPMSIQPNNSSRNLSAVAGQKFVIEFDFMYGGSTGNENVNDPIKNSYTFHGIAKQTSSSNTTQAGCRYWYNSNSDYLTIDKTNTKAEERFIIGVWYNFRVEYTINADGSASYAAYINNSSTPIYTGADESAATTIYGWSFCGRGNGTTTLSYDNMYIGVSCADHEYEEVKGELNYVGNGEFYNMCPECGLCDMNTKFTATAGNGTYFNDDTIGGAKVNVGVDTLKINRHSNTAVEDSITDDGTLTIVSSGYDMLTMIPGGSKLNLEKGKKYVFEFDLFYEGTSLSEGDNNVFFGITSRENSGNGGFLTGTGGYLNFKGDYAYLDYGTNAKSGKLLKGVWYNLRMEYTVTDSVVENGTTTNSYTFALYVDDADTPAFTINSTNTMTELYGLCLQGRSGTHTIKLDNFYMGNVCTGHEYEDVAPTANTFKALNEEGVAVFHKQACVNCGRFEGEYTYAGVTLGEGTYYANPNMSGNRQDFTGVTATGNGDGIFSGYNNAADVTSKYSFVNTRENDILRLFASTANNWSYAAMKVKGTNASNPISAGDKIVAEIDVRILGGNSGDFMRFYLASAGNGTTTGSVSPVFAFKGNDTNGFSFCDTTLVKGVWYNIRIEQIVDGATSVYINGELVKTLEAHVSGATNLSGFSILTIGTLVEAEFDNLYVGINPSETSEN